jgi:hypothetical protein
METRIREILINWAKFKDQVPVDNSDKDPLYTQKLRLLFTGQESLGKSTFQEWSKDVVSRFETIDDYRDYSFTQGACLAGLIVDMVEDHLCIESWDDKRVTSQQWAAFKAMWHAIESLTPFSSKDLLEVLEDSPKNDNKSSHQQIIESVELIEKRYLLAMKGANEGNIYPLLDLCDATFTALLHAKQVSTIMAKGVGPRKAAQKRHEPSNKTKAYTISLCVEKLGGSKPKNKTAFAKSIHDDVVAYGLTVGHEWNDDWVAKENIYEWVRLYFKDQ